MQAEQIYANYTNETNLIPSLFLGAVHPTMESKKNIEKHTNKNANTQRTPGTLVHAKEADKKYETAILKNENNTERQQIKNKGEKEQIEIAENIYLLPFLYEKSTKGIQENAPKGKIDRAQKEIADKEEYILNNEKNKN